MIFPRSDINVCIFTHFQAPEAQDFSSINDALTDDSSSSDEEAAGGDQKSTIEAAAKVIKTEPDQQPPTIVKTEMIHDDDDDEDNVPKDETRLMPPPLSAPQQASISSQINNAGPVKKPLAAMLPSKYKNVDVKELFPEYRENQVLRFSRLFPIKASHKPRIWKNVKRRFKLEADSERAFSPPKRTRSGEWELYAAPPPTDPNAYVEDQAVRFHRPFQAKSDQEGADSGGDSKKAFESRGPRPTDWRNGPAQYWYESRVDCSGKRPWLLRKI
jgi:transcription initiation factor TFIID subunit 1